MQECIIISCFLYHHKNACCGLAVRGLTHTAAALSARIIINIVYKTIDTVKEKPLLLPRVAICLHVNCYVYLSHFMPAAVKSNVHTVGYDKREVMCQDRL